MKKDVIEKKGIRKGIRKMLDYASIFAWIFKIDFCTPKFNNKKDGFRKR